MKYHGIEKVWVLRGIDGNYVCNTIDDGAFAFQDWFESGEYKDVLQLSMKQKNRIYYLEQNKREDDLWSYVREIAEDQGAYKCMKLTSNGLEELEEDEKDEDDLMRIVGIEF